MNQGITDDASKPSGHPGTEESPTVQKAGLRARASSDRFAEHLRFFVERWAPKDPFDRDEFQRDMMHLFVDAMRNQTDHVSLGFEIYASDMFRQRAMAPLHAIFEPPKAAGK